MIAFLVKFIACLFVIVCHLFGEYRLLLLWYFIMRMRCVQTVRVHYQQNVHCRTVVANHCRRSSGWLYEILQLDATSGHATLSPHPAHRRPHLGTDRARRINGAEFRLTASADYSSAPGGPHRADRQSVGPLKITPPPPPPRPTRPSYD